MDRYCLRAAIVDNRFVDWESRVWIHDLGSSFAEHEDRKEHGDLATRDDDDAFGVNINIVTFVQVGGDGFPQLQQSVGGRITVVTVAQRFDGRFHNMLRRFEIRLANAKIDDFLAFTLKRRCPRQHLECGFCSQPTEIIRQFHYIVPYPNEVCSIYARALSETKGMYCKLGYSDA